MDKEEFTSALLGDCTISFPPETPVDAEVIDVFWSGIHRSFLITLEHPSFKVHQPYDEVMIQGRILIIPISNLSHLFGG